MDAMSTGSNAHSGNYSAVIDEIYAEMGRQRLNQVALAARLGHPQPWLNRRLMGHTVMTFTEVEDIADALGLTVWDLFARASDPVVQRRTATRVLRSARAVALRYRPRKRVAPHHDGLRPQSAAPFPQSREAADDLIGVAS